MRNVPLWKIVLVIVLLAACAISAAPTFKLGSLFAPLVEVFGGSADAYERDAVTYGLDLQGGLDLTYRIKSEKEEDMIKAIEVLRNRLDNMGVANVSIQRQGLRQIRIQIPGIGGKKQKQIKNVINTVDLLRFNLVKQESPNMFSLVPGAEDELLPGVVDKNTARKKEAAWYLLKKEPELTGDALSHVRIAFDSLRGKPKIQMEFHTKGAEKFAAVTENLVGKRLAIVLARKVYMAPVIKEPIRDGHAEITGDFDIEEAKLVTNILKAGALPCELIKLAENSVGPTLGKESIQKGIYAATAGVILVLVFMVVWYKLAGLFADAAMVMNLLMIIAMLKFFGATLTMPGIAGLILTIGMSVDANVIIFERIREELRNGKTIRASIDAGFNKAFSTILDANLTTFFTALVLYFFGTGPIKGFAVTLSLGILASMFTALFVVKLIMDMTYANKSTGTISI